MKMSVAEFLSLLEYMDKGHKEPEHFKMFFKEEIDKLTVEIVKHAKDENTPPEFKATAMRFLRGSVDPLPGVDMQKWDAGVETFISSAGKIPINVEKVMVKRRKRNSRKRLCFDNSDKEDSDSDEDDSDSDEEGSEDDDDVEQTNTDSNDDNEESDAEEDDDESDESDDDNNSAVSNLDLSSKSESDLGDNSV
jgi:hypothetical protein